MGVNGPKVMISFQAIPIIISFYQIFQFVQIYEGLVYKRFWD